MNDEVLRLTNISKSYRSTLALEGLDLVINPGEIFGLIGENGAGKSTLINIINGLIRPTTGDVTLFGKNDRKQIAHQRSRVGFVPDTNALYPSLSARDNLEIRRIEWGIPDKVAVKEALEEVGLSTVGKKKVRHFSLGMRRRLDLAVALLGKPDFLILDEPTNGLDPVGIIEVRELLKSLNMRSGTTILVSSHILSELHEMATQYLILSQGKLVECMSSAELDSRCKRHLKIRVNDPDRAVLLFETILNTRNYTVEPGGTIRLYEFPEQSEEVTNLLVENRIGVESISIEEDSLEAYYVNLIGSGNRK